MLIRSPHTHHPALVLLLAACLLLFAGCAAQQHLDKGRAAMLRDDPLTARYHFERAVVADASLASKPEIVAEFRAARRDAAIKEGDLALKEDEPITAAERYRAALSADPDSAAALAGLEIANRQAAELYLRQATRQADRNGLTSARQSLTDALEYDSEHPRVVAALRSLDLPVDEQPAEYRDALVQAEAGQWEDAITRLQSTITHHPQFLPARAALNPMRQRAAEAMIASAQSHLTDEDLDAAETDYRRAKSLQPDHREISRGLAEVQIARAALLDKSGRPGAALLAYRAANSHRTSLEARDAIARIKADITAQHRVAARVQPAANAPDGVAAADLADRVADRLAADPTMPVDVAAEGQPVTVSLQALSIEPVKTTSVAKRFIYQVPEQVDNPEVDALESRLAFLESQLRYARYFHGPPRYRVRVGHDSGYRYGFRSTYTYGRSFNYDRLYDEYRCTARDLVNTPRTLTVYQEEAWPYTLFTHTRTGELRLAYTLGDGPPRATRAVFRETDTSIDKPKPDLGLPADPRSMTDEPQVRETLLIEGTDRLASAIARAMVQQRVAELREAAREAEAVGNAEQATEASVAAAVLVSHIDPAVGQQLLSAAK